MWSKIKKARLGVIGLSGLTQEVAGKVNELNLLADHREAEADALKRQAEALEKTAKDFRDQAKDKLAEAASSRKIAKKWAEFTNA